MGAGAAGTNREIPGQGELSRIFAGLGVKPVLWWHMHGKHEPARIVREAWSVVRLDRIREVIDETIDKLQRLPPRELLGRELSSAELQFCENPIREALESCCDELRDECGTSQSNQRRSAHTELVRRCLADQPHPHWASTYQDALARYRSSAGVALRDWLDTVVSNGVKGTAAADGAGAS